MPDNDLAAISEISEAKRSDISPDSLPPASPAP